MKNFIGNQNSLAVVAVALFAVLSNLWVATFPMDAESNLASTYVSVTKKTLTVVAPNTTSVIDQKFVDVKWSMPSPMLYNKGNWTVELRNQYASSKVISFPPVAISATGTKVVIPQTAYDYFTAGASGTTLENIKRGYYFYVTSGVFSISGISYQYQGRTNNFTLLRNTGAVDSLPPYIGRVAVVNNTDGSTKEIRFENIIYSAPVMNVYVNGVKKYTASSTNSTFIAPAGGLGLPNGTSTVSLQLENATSAGLGNTVTATVVIREGISFIKPISNQSIPRSDSFIDIEWLPYTLHDIDSYHVSFRSGTQQISTAGCSSPDLTKLSTKCRLPLFETIKNLVNPYLEIRANKQGVFGPVATGTVRINFVPSTLPTISVSATASTSAIKTSNTLGQFFVDFDVSALPNSDIRIKDFGSITYNIIDSNGSVVISGSTQSLTPLTLLKGGYYLPGSRPNENIIIPSGQTATLRFSGVYSNNLTAAKNVALKAVSLKYDTGTVLTTKTSGTTSTDFYQSTAGIIYNNFGSSYTTSFINIGL